MSTPSIDIDGVLYSRQLYVLGHAAQRKLATSSVLVVGAKGLGTETAKNLVLTGLGSLSLYDPEPVQTQDLGTNFLLREEDIGKARATAIVPRLKELNPHASIKVLELDTTSDSDHRLLDAIKACQFDLVLITDPIPSSTSTPSIPAPLLTETKLLEINDWTHANNVPFICTSTHGLFGSIFNDFVRVQSTIPSSDGAEGEREETLQFKALRDSLQHPLLSSPSTDPKVANRIFTLHVGFISLSAFFESQHRLPSLRPTDTTQPDDSKTFAGLARVVGAGINGHVIRTGEGHEEPHDTGAGSEGSQSQHELDIPLLEELAYQSTTSLAPMVTLFGGLAAQEAIKALTGSGGRPIFQHFYFDASDALLSTPTNSSATVSVITPHPPSRYDSQRAIFGENVQTALQNRKEFIVGAGAVGSEMLKCLALMGVGAGTQEASGGKLWVEDSGKVKKTNIALQVLYRAEDVGKLKCDVVKRRLEEMNPDLVGRVDVGSRGIGSQSEEFFGDAFFDTVDGITVAVDDVRTRLYLSQRSILHRLPLLEANIEGPNARVRIAIPDLTEPWSDVHERDQSKAKHKDLESGTIGKFPTEFEHVIEWSRHRYYYLFGSPVEGVNAYLSDPNYIESATKSKWTGTSLTMLEQIKTYLVDSRPHTFEDCIAWAKNEYVEVFDQSFRRFLEEIPRNSVTSAGALFWTPPRRCPDPVTFDSNDSTHLDFIVATANIYAHIYGINGSADREAIKGVVDGVFIPPFQPKRMVAVTVEPAEDKPTEEAAEAALKLLIASLPPPSSFAGFSLQTVDFKLDGDDETNLHIDYIASASRLRAQAFGIEPWDTFETRRTAGRIIPGIVTTAAVAAGLACLEYYKMASTKPEITVYRHSDVNTLSSLPIVTSTPVTPKRNTLGKEIWTAWDRIEFSGETTLDELKVLFEKKYELEVVMVCHATSMLWSTFLKWEKREERLPMKFSEVIEKVSKTRILPWVKYLVVEVVLQDGDGEDVEAPFIIVPV